MDKLASVQVGWIFFPKPERRYRPSPRAISSRYGSYLPCLELLQRFGFKWISVYFILICAGSFYSRMLKSLKYIIND